MAACSEGPNVPMWSLDLFQTPGLALEDKVVARHAPPRRIRPALVLCHLFFGLWDVRLAWLYVAGVRLKQADY